MRALWTRWKAPLLIGASAAMVACGGPAGTNPDGGTGINSDGNLKSPLVDLRADVNRDGVVSLDDPSEDLNEDTWDENHGAIFLANIDDDEGVCPWSTTTSDVSLPTCNDAADEVINGPDDLLDLAYLRTVPWADAPDGTVATVRVSDKAADFVRLFKSDASGYVSFDLGGAVFDAAAIRTGLELAIEGKDIVRDPSVWDGFVDVTFEVMVPGGTAFKSGTFTDVVRMRIAPVMTFHHLLPAEHVYVSDVSDPDSDTFRAALSTDVSASGPNPPDVVVLGDFYDQWAQDFFEPAYMSMPAANGTQHVIRVNYRSANIFYPNSASNPLREAGKAVFKLRGKDVAAIQQFDKSSDPQMDSLNSFGNTETIPPYTLDGVSYPLGRLFRGSIPTFHPDPSFSRMLESQAMQPPVYVDTSWLYVGHVDETFSFLKVDSPRGWIVLVNDANLARKMLQDQVTAGNGAVKMFVGQKWVDNNLVESPADISISDVLADTDVMNESASSAANVDAQLAKVREATGLTDAEIIHVPYLHEPVNGFSLAYQPGTVNMLNVNPGNVIAPDPHGPMIAGKDLFKDQLETALQPFGVQVHWVDDWNLYHRLAGEVHCGTNAAREIPAVKWWETGR